MNNKENHLLHCSFKLGHGYKADNDVEFFKNLRDNLRTMGGMFEKVDKQNMDGLVASYNISLLIAKTGSRILLVKNPFFPRFKIQ